MSAQSKAAEGHTVLDRTGVIASVGCAIHCMIAPILILAAPALGGWWVHPMTHLLIALVVLPVAMIALYRGFKVHRRHWILIAGGVGMLLVSVGVVLPYTHPAPEPIEAEGHSICQSCCPTVQVDEATGDWDFNIPLASIVTMLGGIALVSAHAGNLRCGCANRACSATTREP
ncbi:MAG: MerC domain-containing protein [Planctomycetota bacterium]